MKRKFIDLAVLLLIVVVVWSAVFGIGKLIGNTYNASYPSGNFNYRMTIKLEAPEGIKEASAVRKVCFSSEPKILPEQHNSYYGVCQGEAIGIDLGKDGMLFALMQGTNNDEDQPHSIVLKYFPGREHSTHGEKATLVSKDYPKFIRFSNMDDLTTAQRVLFSKEEPHVDDGAYGGRIKILEINLEITGDPVVPKIAEYRKRLFTKGALWRRGPLNYGDPLNFGLESFERGMEPRGSK